MLMYHLWTKWSKIEQQTGLLITTLRYPKNGSYLKMSAINMIFKNQKDSINNFPFFGGSVDHFGKGQ